MNAERLLCFDFGEKRIGVATGSRSTGNTQALNTLTAKSGQPNWDIVASLIHEWQPDAMLVGLPLNMDGTRQEVTTWAEKFARRLHGRFGLPVTTMDERLSTVEVKARLEELGGVRKVKNSQVDSLAAELILQSWFNQAGNTDQGQP